MDLFMTPMLEMITRHEGKQLMPYEDTEGILTIGVGHNLRDRGISESVCDLMLEEDIQSATADAHSFRWFSSLNEPRQAVIVNMIFNLGLNRFREFKKTISYLSNELYQTASREMLDSKWALQVGNRAVELSEMMSSGKWPDEH